MSVSPVLPGGSGVGSATAFAESIIDIIISTPASFTGGLIPVSFRPHLRGSVSASLIESFSPFSRGAGANLTARASISGQPINALSGPSFRSVVEVNAVASASGNITSGADTDGEFLPDIMVLPTIFINPLVSVQVKLSMRVLLGHAAFNDSTATATVDAFNSLSFALVGPALILPDGFTANSVSGMIVDNVYVGAPVSAVPLPAAGPLFIAALAGLGFLSRRRRAV